MLTQTVAHQANEKVDTCLPVNFTEKKLQKLNIMIVTDNGSIKWRAHVRTYPEFVSWQHSITLYRIIMNIRYYPLSLSKLRRTFAQ